MVDGDTDCIWHKKAQTVTKQRRIVNARDSGWFSDGLTAKCVASDTHHLITLPTLTHLVASAIGYNIRRARFCFFIFLL